MEVHYRTNDVIRTPLDQAPLFASTGTWVPQVFNPSTMKGQDFTTATAFDRTVWTNVFTQGKAGYHSGFDFTQSADGLWITSEQTANSSTVYNGYTKSYSWPQSGFQTAFGGKDAGFGYGTFHWRARSGQKGQGPGVNALMWRGDGGWIDSKYGNQYTEIDIFEAFSANGTSISTLHSYDAAAPGGNGQSFHPLKFPANTDNTTFHDYDMVWGPGTLALYIDGVLQYNDTSSHVPKDYAHGDCNRTHGTQVVIQTSAQPLPTMQLFVANAWWSPALTPPVSGSGGGGSPTPTPTPTPNPTPTPTPTGTLTVSVNHPSNLGIGNQTFSVIVSGGTIASGSYGAYWQNFGTPAPTGSFWNPITKNSDGTYSVTVNVDKAGVPGTMFTTSGTVVTNQWSDTPSSTGTPTPTPNPTPTPTPNPVPTNNTNAAKFLSKCKVGYVIDRTRYVGAVSGLPSFKAVANGGMFVRLFYGWDPSDNDGGLNISNGVPSSAEVGKIDAVITWCQQNNVPLIIGLIDYMRDSDVQSQGQTLTRWMTTVLAHIQSLKTDPTMVAIEVCNEHISKNNATLSTYILVYEQLVRNYLPEHPIARGNHNFNAAESFDTTLVGPLDKNYFLRAHDYEDLSAQQWTSVFTSIVSLATAGGYAGVIFEEAGFGFSSYSYTNSAGQKITVKGQEYDDPATVWSPNFKAIVDACSPLNIPVATWGLTTGAWQMVNSPTDYTLKPAVATIINNASKTVAQGGWWNASSNPSSSGSSGGSSSNSGGVQLVIQYIPAQTAGASLTISGNVFNITSPALSYQIDGGAVVSGSPVYTGVVWQMPITGSLAVGTHSIAVFLTAAPSLRVVSNVFVVNPANTGITVTVQHPSPLYAATQALAVSFSSPPPAGSTYFVAWRTIGIPPVTSPEFRPVVFASNGTATVTVTIDNVGTLSTLYLSDGTNVRALWSDTPIAGSPGSSGSSGGSSSGSSGGSPGGAYTGTYCFNPPTDTMGNNDQFNFELALDRVTMRLNSRQGGTWGERGQTFWPSDNIGYGQVYSYYASIAQLAFRNVMAVRSRPGSPTILDVYMSQSNYVIAAGEPFVFWQCNTNGTDPQNASNPAKFFAFGSLQLPMKQELVIVDGANVTWQDQNNANITDSNGKPQTVQKYGIRMPAGVTVPSGIYWDNRVGAKTPSAANPILAGRHNRFYLDGAAKTPRNQVKNYFDYALNSLYPADHWIVLPANQGQPTYYEFEASFYNLGFTLTDNFLDGYMEYVASRFRQFPDPNKVLWELVNEHSLSFTKTDANGKKYIDPGWYATSPFDGAECGIKWVNEQYLIPKARKYLNGYPITLAIGGPSFCSLDGLLTVSDFKLPNDGLPYAGKAHVYSQIDRQSTVYPDLNNLAPSHYNSFNQMYFRGDGFGDYIATALSVVKARTGFAMMILTECGDDSYYQTNEPLRAREGGILLTALNKQGHAMMWWNPEGDQTANTGYYKIDGVTNYGAQLYDAPHAVKLLTSQWRGPESVKAGGALPWDSPTTVFKAPALPNVATFIHTIPSYVVQLPVGGNASWVYAATASRDYKGTPKISITGMPSGMTATIPQVSIAGVNDTRPVFQTITMATTSAVGAGLYTLTITTDDGSVSRVTPLVIQVGSTTNPPPTTKSITVTNPGVQTEPTTGAGVYVQFTITTTGSLKTVYAAVLTANGSLEGSWQQLPLDATGNASITLHMQTTGDYVSVTDSVTTPTVTTNSQPVTINTGNPTPILSITIAHPSPLYSGQQNIAVTFKGTIPTGVAYYAAWIVGAAPLASSAAFQPIVNNSDGTSSVSLNLTPPGTQGTLYLTDRSSVLAQWTDTPLVPITQKALFFTISDPGTVTSVTTNSGADIVFSFGANGWSQIFVAVFDKNSAQLTNWVAVTIGSQGSGTTTLHMSNTGDYVQAVDLVTNTTIRSFSKPVTIKAPTTAPIIPVAIAVNHPHPLYVGQQTLPVAIAGSVPVGAIYYAVWSSTGVPSLSSSSFQPIVINADGSAQVTVYVTNAGTTGALYTVDGQTISLQWRDTPTDAPGTSSSSGGSTTGTLIAESAQGPLHFQVYATTKTLTFTGYKTYGSVATLKIIIDGQAGGVLLPDVPDGVWSVSRPMLSDGQHSIVIYVDGDVANIARATVYLPIDGTTSLSPITPLQAYILCKSEAETALETMRLLLGL